MHHHLSTEQPFSALSLKDLLDAREQFHVHLLSKPNVVGTAVGRYLFRRDDPQPGEPRSAHPDKPRLLSECEVREYSWPCVLVFLNEWKSRKDFTGDRGGLNYEDYIPRAIYLPDGRKVPICKVHALPQPPVEQDVTDMVFPSTVIGGGYPVIADVQKEQHVASIGCLVSDGHKTYALTNRHVCGEPGEVLFTRLNGNLVRIGATSKLYLGKKPFQEVYPDWQGKEVLVNMDVGLIEVDDLSQWTSQIYGLGKLGRTADVSTHTLSLNLIGCEMRAYGCASRQMFGQVLALFYRYKSLGGIEYVSDLLIGPCKDKQFNPRRGDSGTTLVIQESETGGELMPIALLWGGQVFGGSNGQQSPFALATYLSTVCTQLDVDVVADWRNEYPAYWGAVGHYSLTAMTSMALRNERLRRLMDENLTRITFDPAHISAVEMKGLSKRPFVPLADVADMVWRFTRGSGEGPNHFADIDHPKQPNLLTLCRNPANVNVDVWMKYYDGIEKKKPGDRGLLPFRVWQVYEDMERFAAAGDVEHFVCAAGILSHYVADACQPLHASYLAKGDPENPTNVHSGYEKDMLEVKGVPAELMEEIRQQVTPDDDMKPIKSGHDAALCTMELMRETLRLLPPQDVTETYDELTREGISKREISKRMWEKFKDQTIGVMTLGCRTLAHLWDSAWENANVDEERKIADSDLRGVNEEVLAEIYSNPEFLPSRTLNKIGPLLSRPTAHPEKPRKGKAAHAKAKAKAAGTRAA